MRPADQTEYIVQCIREAGSMYEDDARQFLATHDTHVRAEAAADVHRAELPKFPAGETPETVAKVVRAVDVRLAAWGSEAPYGVARSDEKSSREADATPDELARLRAFAEANARRHKEIRALLSRVEITGSGEAWDLSMSVLALLDGPLPRANEEAVR